MQAKRLKCDPLKRRCDRCQQLAPPIHECRFSFADQRYADWKALWQERTGQRFTNRRKAQLRERPELEIDLKEFSGVVFWMDLCPACWELCSLPCPDVWPMEFYHTILGALNIPAEYEVRVKGAETFIRKKTEPLRPGEVRRSSSVASTKKLVPTK